MDVFQQNAKSLNSFGFSEPLDLFINRAMNMMVTLQRRNALSEKKALWAFLKGYLTRGAKAKA